jgi:maleylacetoacetate isomerase
MKLYSYYRSSTSYRVRIALALKGLAYEQSAVNLVTSEQTGEAYRRVNPQGRVPSLETDGETLIQSPAILEWLDETYPDPPLLPGDALARARIREVCMVIGCDIHPVNNSGLLGRLRALGHDEATVMDWLARWMNEGLAVVEHLIAPAPYAFGETPTMADLYIVPQVFNARRYGIDLGPYPKIRAVDAVCAEHPAFQAAAPAVQPDAA